ncbi:MAG: hypothetical protein AAFS10_18570, partial [Myxococcota bacterium]
MQDKAQTLYDRLIHRLKTSGRATLAYWLMTFYGLAVFSGVVLFMLPGPEVAMILLGFVLGTIVGQVLGNGFALLKPRWWVVAMTVSTCCGMLSVAPMAAIAIPAAGPMLLAAWFILPFAITSGFCAIRYRMEIFGAWIPLMYSVGGALVWINVSPDKLAAWHTGSKWAIWDMVTVPILAGALLLFIIYLVMRQSQALSLWQDSTQMPDTPGTPRRYKPRARISWTTWGCIGVLALALTITTAAVSPYLFRTGSGDKEGGGQSRGDGEPRSGRGEPQEGEPEPKEEEEEADPFEAPDADWDKVREGIEEAARQGFNLLMMLIILLIVVVLIYLLFWRPIQRLAVLRHLENPAWAVPATQRIQDLWRRVHIALHDAGVELSASEPAERLAERAGAVLAKQFGEPPPGLDEAAAIYTRVHYNIG